MKKLLWVLLLSNSAWLGAVPLWSSIYDEPGAQILTAGAAWRSGESIAVGFDTGAGAGNLLALKVDAVGQIVWRKTYSLSSYAERADAVIALPDGDAILIGSANLPQFPADYRPWLLRIDGSGEIVWSSAATFTLDIAVDSAVVHGVLRQSGQLVIAGGANGFSDVQDPWVAVISTDGELESFQSFTPLLGGGFGVATYISDMITTRDGGVLLSGTASSYPGQAYIWKFDDHVTPQWHQVYAGENIETVAAILETDQGFAFAGPAYGYDAAAFGHTDALGNLLTLGTYGSESGYSSADAILRGTNGSFKIVRNTFPAFGSIRSQAQLLTVNPEGLLLSTEPLPGGEIGTTLGPAYSDALHQYHYIAGYARISEDRSDSAAIVQLLSRHEEVVFTSGFDQPDP